MLVGYFDESGLDEVSKTFCIAGYIADSTSWFEFSRAWRSRLDEDNIAVFHMADYESRHGPYLGWSNPRRVQFIQELIAIINSTEVWGIGVGIPRDAFARVVSQIAPPPQMPAAWWTHPYVFAFTQCLVQSALEVNHLPADVLLSFVFDYQAEFKARAVAVHHDLQSAQDWPRHARIGSLTFTSKTADLPLQAADFAVYEIRKGIDAKFFGPVRPERKTLSRLRRRIRNPLYFDEGLLRRALTTPRA